MHFSTMAGLVASTPGKCSLMYCPTMSATLVTSTVSRRSGSEIGMPWCEQIYSKKKNDSDTQLVGYF